MIAFQLLVEQIGNARPRDAAHGVLPRRANRERTAGCAGMPQAAIIQPNSVLGPLGGEIMSDEISSTATDCADDPAALVLRHTEVAATSLVPEIPLRLLRSDSPLWRAFGDEPDAATIRRPYWAFAWSGGQALARFLLDRPERVAGRRVLDFAAGGGLAGIAAMRAGAARVNATEIDPVAIAAIALNAELNGVQLAAACEDVIYSPNQGWDVVLAGDIWYDSRLARHGLNWLQSLAGEGVDVLTAEPGRHYSPAGILEELACYRARSVPDLEHPRLQEVHVYRIPPVSGTSAARERA
jgi:predicted nicotinamide N-methyase